MSAFTEERPPPGRAAAPGVGVPRAVDKIRRDTGISRTQRTAAQPRGSATYDYLEGRQRVLGSIRLHREPTLAASMLAEEMGPASARAWLRRCLAELEGHR